MVEQSWVLVQTRYDLLAETTGPCGLGPSHYYKKNSEKGQGQVTAATGACAETLHRKMHRRLNSVQ